MGRTVSDWMSAKPSIVRRDTPITGCAQRLASDDVRHLVVVDDGGRLCGLLSYSEVWRRGELRDDTFVPLDPEESALTAQQLTRVAEVEVGPEAALANSLQALIGSMQDAIVVVDDTRRPIGLLSEAEAVARCAADLSEEGPPVARPTVLVDKDSLADDARSLMARRRARHAIVLDGDRLYGVLSFRDVAVEAHIAGGATAGSLATRPAHSAPEGVSFRGAANLLTTHRIGCLPVVDEGLRPTGWITRTHIVTAWLDENPTA
ncbi:MAG: CBS domain-containing protein [Myxococcota bacterium]